MLKRPVLVKTREFEAVERLRWLLGRISTLRLSEPRLDCPIDGGELDALIGVEESGRRFQLLVEFKAKAQPQQARFAISQLQRFAKKVGGEAITILVAPYLSEQARELCRDSGVCFLDLEGNAYIAFGSVFIERIVASKPPAEQRELKSLYKPKAAQVLRTLLRDPARIWRMSQLAEESDVSLGHVSNVRAALVERDWAEATEEGLALVAPNPLLDEWRDSYDPKSGDRSVYYTTLHGEAFDRAARDALESAGKRGRAAFSSFSAAHWLAPYARISKHYFVADEACLPDLQSALKLESTARGENVVITVPRDPGVLRDLTSPAPAIVCTSALQTYLDLAHTGERGQEAAEYLRERKLKW
jgi:hypothetical protein